MGQEVETSHFTKNDFVKFKENLDRETSLVEKLFSEGGFSSEHGVGGFELEAWVVDASGNPAPINDRYLKALNDPMVDSELAMFNIELNTSPYRLKGDALGRMQAELEETWRKCREKAREFNADITAIGILPTVRNDDLVPENMSNMKRYRALNDQVMRQRKGSPCIIDIHGREDLCIGQMDVMLEAATTAFQIQFQVDFNKSVRFYNAAVVATAPIVAASANSPYMFGRDLWDETRIPVFEQSLAEIGDLDSTEATHGRVTLGFDYARESLVEFLQRNRDEFRVMLPMVYDEAPELLCHARLHNGTVWRWNRPLIGFDEYGKPHLRIEHRAIPAGPSIVDTIANAAFFYGLIQAIGSEKTPPEENLPFGKARDNFYTAAKNGLNANLYWLDGKPHPVTVIILEELLPLARRGLHEFGVIGKDIERYLRIIEERVRSGQNGAAWQRAFTAKHGRDEKRLCMKYMERQNSGLPVHEWTV
ncbi:MAG: glutamate--cysteine ligase [Nitrospinota bacterium]